MNFLSDALEDYISTYSSPEEALLYELYRETNLKTTHPRMLSGHTQGVYLQMMAALISAKSILEIGTFTGYAAICLARGMSDQGKLHTIDIKEELVDMALKYFVKAGLEKQIIQYTGDALAIIPNINHRFDLVFIDADKKNYPQYYDLIIDKLLPGGLIIADNVLWGGKVLEQVNSNDKDTKGLLTFNKMVTEDKRVENVMLPLRDGLMLIRKK